MATDTLFADRIVNLSIANGLVRIELGTVENYLENNERKQRVEVTQRVVMPVEGFVRSFGMQQRMMAQLEERAKKAAEQAGEAKATA